MRLRLSTQDLARDHSRRSDELWIKNALPKGDFFVVDGDLKFLRRPMGSTEETMRFQWADVDRAEKVTPPIFLGTLPNGRPQFVVEANLMGMERFGLRESIDEFVDGNDVNILAMAVGLVQWHRSSKWCANCGERTKRFSGGHARKCACCGTVVFPRVDPAIITLVHDGANRCVLGRAASWKPKRYSTLAGFVEVGESLEDAVRREVFEEVGLCVENISYHASQPWPFPRSLMLGFFCTAVDPSLSPCVDSHELEDAKWFSREDILNGVVDLPPKSAISNHLIHKWLLETKQ